MNNSKQTFLHNEFWILTFGGAFQRANIYKLNVETEKRSAFRIALKNFVSEHIIPQYKTQVCEMSHILNIEGIMAFSEKWHEILNNGKLNIGVSQKLLNLILKYYWCLGEITMPPHCPVDRIIQSKGLEGETISWTTIADINVYLNIINKIRMEAESKNQTIAEWELEVFQRNEN